MYKNILCKDGKSKSSSYLIVKLSMYLKMLMLSENVCFKTFITVLSDNPFKK